VQEGKKDKVKYILEDIERGIPLGCLTLQEREWLREVFGSDWERIITEACENNLLDNLMLP
jgi:hypothetical protein